MLSWLGDRCSLCWAAGRVAWWRWRVADGAGPGEAVCQLDRVELPLGRGKSKLDLLRPEIEAFFANGSTQAFIARRYNTTPANLSNWIKKHGIVRPRP